MNEKEYLNIVKNEIERLKKEYSDIESNQKKIGGQSFEDKAIHHQLCLIEEKIRQLNGLIKYPMYARIQAMDDVELDKYRKEKLIELEAEEQTLLKKIDEINIKYINLGEQLAELTKKFDGDTGTETQDLIYKGMSMDAKLKGYLRSLNSLNTELKSIKKSKEDIINKSSNEIKNELFFKISSSNIDPEFKESINDANYVINEPTIQLLAYIGEDYKKSEELIRLLNDYKKTEKKILNPSGDYLLLPFGISPYLENDLDVYKSNGHVEAPDKVLKTIELHEDLFYDKINDFLSEFTNEKLFGLIGENDFYKKKPNIDFKFLELHKDKIDVLDIEILKKLDYEKKKLLKKSGKFDIEFNNEAIQNKLSDIYEKIYAWYESFDTKIFDMPSIKRKDFATIDSLEKIFRNIKKKIILMQKQHILLKDDISNINDYVKANKIYNEGRLKEIEDRIRILTNNQLDRDKIKLIIDYTAEDLIIQAARVGRAKMIYMINKEAYNQVNMASILNEKSNANESKIK